MLINENDCAVLLIDIQEKLFNVAFNKDIIEKKSSVIVNTAKILNIPLYVTEQYPKGLGETVNGLKEGANVFEKTDFNALNDLELFSSLKNQNKKQIIIFGIETHICVYQTVDALLSNGFEVVVVSDACGSRSEAEYISALNYMSKLGACIKTTEMLVFELLKSAKHPNFKEIQALIK